MLAFRRSSNALLSVFAAAFLLAGCQGETADQPAQAVPKAQVQVIEPSDHMLTTELPGRIAPARTAEVPARVPGIVRERLFTERADVKAGDVLFRIDPQPLEAAVAEARGALAQAEANLYQAASVARRYEGLVESRAISQQQYDSAIAARKSAEAEKLSAEAALKTAELVLGYATVTAP